MPKELNYKNRGLFVFENWKIINPKQSARDRSRQSKLFPYYAGFSDEFAFSIINSASLDDHSCVVDPWNGSGTTTSAAAALGYKSYGYDLNPVMAIVAKARLLNIREKPSICPIRAEIVKKATRDVSVIMDNDSLNTWFLPNSTNSIRNIERAVQELLIDDLKYRSLKTKEDVDSISDLAAFFYTVLFRTLRVLLRGFVTSNPTWIKKPSQLSNRLRPKTESIITVFSHEIDSMLSSIEYSLFDSIKSSESSFVGVASSESLPLPDSSVDLMISSPPYCTRIDYAVATMPELALLGYDLNGDFQNLRRKMIGTSTVTEIPLSPLSKWGKTCISFLNDLKTHGSKASKSYYYKNHLQYYNGIFQSIAEIKRALAMKGVSVIVVQDSYYKNIHNDLPKIFSEMAESNGLSLGHRVDFTHRRSMAGINPAVKPYRTDVNATESVLCLIHK